jgi:hypothetical protein
MATSVEEIIEYLKKEIKDQEFAKDYTWSRSLELFDSRDLQKAYEKGFSDGMDNGAYQDARELLCAIENDEL